MARLRSSYVCQNCGAITQRWQGKCESCGEWNTIIEEAAALGVGAASARRGAAGRTFPLEDLSGASRPDPRVATGIGELDRVAGGGFVPGSATLIGGDPGIGKSTLLHSSLRRRWRAPAHRAVYISGEEAMAQVRLRADRLGLADGAGRARGRNLGRGHRGDAVARRDAATSWSSIRSRPCGATRSNRRPAPSRQVRGSAAELIRFAKRAARRVILVGHVTKDGQIAGPRVVEHMVDAVLLVRGRRRAAVPHFAGGQEPLRRRPTRSACSK